MPSSTFLNLPAEKQEKLLEAATREFSHRPFNEASINQIIKEAGIPRGSFYMYFQDKEDLFRYLLKGYVDQLFMLLEEFLLRAADAGVDALSVAEVGILMMARRLVPQIVYYFAAYAQLLKAGKVRFGDKVDFCVPTGNFGDILAGYYAKQMGLPVGRLICASNENNVLTDFLTTGTYTAKREFFKTTSPSMDILVSSNLERLLYHVTGSDAEVAGLMKSLSETGSYTVRPETLAAIQESFGCGWSSEEEVAGEIRARYEQDGYLCDTHTAVAFHVAGCHKREGVPMVVLSTASPYKFPRSVLEALGRTAPQNDFEAMQELEAATGRTAPASLAALRQKAERFNTVIDPEQIAQVALSYQE